MRPHHSKTLITALRALGVGLAALHLLPAREHIGRFFAHPSVADAWKGFGAVIAIGILLLPLAWQLRALAALGRWKWRVLPLALLALAHAVPASDHLPK